MKFTPSILSVVVLAALQGANAQTFTFPIPGSPVDFAFNLEAIDIFAKLGAFIRSISFGLLVPLTQGGCPEVFPVDVDVDDLFSQPFYPFLAQPTGFLPEERFNCVAADDMVKDGLPFDYVVQTRNIALNAQGEVFGPDAPEACVAPTASPGKFIIALCDLPPVLGRDSWYLAVEDDFVITVGGQPNIQNPETGFCSNDLKGQVAGIILATRGIFPPSQDLIDRALAKAKELKLDTTRLIPFNTEGVPGTKCTDLTLPASGIPFGDMRKVKKKKGGSRD